jgi:hypothetical protein
MALNPVKKQAGVLKRRGGGYQAIIILNEKRFLAENVRNTIGEAKDDLRRLKADLLYDIIPGLD